MSNLKTIKVEIQNVTEAQAITLETMFALWSRLGRVGSSRWVSFMADGDGNFRPTILVNDRPAKESELVELNECIEPIKRCITKNGDGQDLETPIWNTDPEVYFLDFDKVAWKLHDVSVAVCPYCKGKGKIFHWEFGQFVKCGVCLGQTER